MTETAARAGPFVHEALFYQSPQEYVAGTVPFVRNGLAAVSSAWSSRKTPQAIGRETGMAQCRVAPPLRVP